MPSPTPHPVSVYAFCFRRVNRYLGSADVVASAEGDAVLSSSPYTLDLLKKQICQSDVEVCSLIASVDDHPYRNKFFTETPDAIASGARIPGYIGVHGGVEIQIASVWYPGKLAQNLEHLNRAKDKYAINTALIPASSLKLYWIDNGKLHFVASGTSGRVYTPTIPIADDTAGTPTLATPKALQFALIAHALSMLAPLGSDSNHRAYWGQIWSGYVSMILSGKESIPEPEMEEQKS